MKDLISNEFDEVYNEMKSGNVILKYSDVPGNKPSGSTGKSSVFNTDEAVKQILANFENYD